MKNFMIAAVFVGIVCLTSRKDTEDAKPAENAVATCQTDENNISEGTQPSRP